MRLQDDEVLLAADRDVRVDEVAELEQQALGLLGGLVLLGVGGLDVGGELPGLLQQLGLLVAVRPWGSACRAPSARSAARRSGRRTTCAARRRRAGRRRARRPLHGRAGRRAHGRGPHGAGEGQSPGQGYRCGDPAPRLDYSERATMSDIAGIVGWRIAAQCVNESASHSLEGACARCLVDSTPLRGAGLGARVVHRDAAPAKLSTGCARDLWTSELIIPNGCHGRWIPGANPLHTHFRVEMGRPKGLIKGNEVDEG